jgi:hypothetical protein
MAGNYQVYIIFAISLLGFRALGDTTYSNVHITLGDYFTNVKSDVIYRVGFMATKEEIPVDLSLELLFTDSKSVRRFTNPLCRQYEYHGFAPDTNNTIKVDYERLFCFFEVTDLADFGTFSYSLKVAEMIVKGPFIFKSKIMSNPSPVIVTFGDHDTTIAGQSIVKVLQSYEFDLLIILGDVAYDIFDDNGKNGDKYFDDMETIFTSRPLIITPGNHENIDDTKMFTNRFVMPGTKLSAENNLFAFKVGNILFLSVNFDVVLWIDKDHFWNYLNQLNILLDSYTKQQSFDWIVFFSHRPIYCSEYNLEENRCAQNIFQMKPFEDILLKYKVNLYLHGHIHSYERYSPMNGYKIGNQENSAILIIGTGGNNEYFTNFEPFDIQFKQRQIMKTTGFTVIKATEEKLSASFIESDSLDVLDSIVLRQPWDRINIFRLSLVLLAIAVGLVIACHFSKKRAFTKEVKMEIREEIDQIK